MIDPQFERRGPDRRKRKPGFAGLFGAIFGLVWALAGYAATRGRRDFTSVSQVVATRYEVLVEHKFAEQARQVLATMTDPKV